jgi:hypothetical protein
MSSMYFPKYNFDLATTKMKMLWGYRILVKIIVKSNYEKIDFKMEDKNEWPWRECLIFIEELEIW